MCDLRDSNSMLPISPRRTLSLPSAPHGPSIREAHGSKQRHDQSQEASLRQCPRRSQSCHCEIVRANLRRGNRGTRLLECLVRPRPHPRSPVCG